MDIAIHFRRQHMKRHLLRAGARFDARTIDKEPACIPDWQQFTSGDGGEFRKSFHGFPFGYAQLVHSPQTFQFNPMQIDTWNRDEMKNVSAPFVPGLLPKSRLP